jgi:hypothetical protein
MDVPRLFPSPRQQLFPTLVGILVEEKSSRS